MKFNAQRFASSEHGLQPQAGAVSYSREADGDLATFEESPKYARLMDQYRDGIAVLRGMGPKTQTDSFDTFLGRMEEGRTGFYSTEIGLLYGEGKRAFDLLVAHARDDTRPLETRAAASRHLAEGIEVCTDGTLSNLIMATRDALQGYGGLPNYARSTLDRLLDQTIADFVRKTHAGEFNYLGNEIHYVSGYRNLLAARYGLDTREDNMVPPSVRADDNLKQCSQYVEQAVTPEQLLRALAEDALMQVRDKFATRWSEAFSDDSLDAFARDYQNVMAPPNSLEATFGKLPVEMLVNAFGRNGDYQLIEDPTLLMAQLQHNLTEAGLIELDDADRMPDGPGIKRVGDAFYRQENSQGIPTFRPLKVGDVRANPGGLDPVGQQIWLFRSFESEDTVLAESLAEAIPAFREPSLSREQRNDYGDTVLMIAVRKGHIGVIGKLLEKGANPDLQSTDGTTALMTAALNGHTATVGKLLEHKASPDLQTSNGGTALMAAAQEDHIEIVEKLLENKADPNLQSKDGTTALMTAALFGYTKTVEKLLEKGASPDLQNRRGLTALMVAAQEDHIEIVEKLLENKADLNQRDKDGSTALMRAAHYGHTGTAEKLLERNAEPDLQDQDGITALMRAAHNGHAGTVEKLLEKGASPDLQDQRGFTALMHAALADKFEIVEKLLGAKADPNLMNSSGRNALSYSTDPGVRRLLEPVTHLQAALTLEVTPGLERSDSGVMFLPQGDPNPPEQIPPQPAAAGHEQQPGRGEPPPRLVPRGGQVREHGRL